jgi:hypothetical protein
MINTGTAVASMAVTEVGMVELLLVAVVVATIDAIDHLRAPHPHVTGEADRTPAASADIAHQHTATRAGGPEPRTRHTCPSP